MNDPLVAEVEILRQPPGSVWRYRWRVRMGGWSAEGSADLRWTARRRARQAVQAQSGEHAPDVLVERYVLFRERWLP